MRTLRSIVLLSPVALVLGTVLASAGPAKTNDLVAFGACCGSDVGIYVIKPNGSGQKRIFKPKYDDASLYAAWSPSGTRLAYVAGDGLRRERRPAPRGRPTESGSHSPT